MTKLPQNHNENKFEVRDLRSGNWFWINKAVLEHPDLIGSDQQVYSALAFFANSDNQRCYPSIPTISNLVHLHEDTIRKAVKKLKNAGFIKVERTLGKVNRYTLLKLTESKWVDRITPRKNHTTRKRMGGPLEKNRGNPPEKNRSNNNNNNNNNLTKIYTQVFECWNNQKIIIHRTLTDKTKRTINGRLKEKYTADEICKAIANYAEIVRDEQYYFKYKWTLQHFLQRGFDRFLDLETARNNFKRGGINGTNQRDFTKEDYTGGKYGERVKKG